MLLFITLISIHYCYAFIPLNPLEIKYKIVELSSALLPNIDTIGHNLLLKNEIYIKFILHNENIPENIKKNSILDIIKFTQHADEFGGFILSHYHDLIDYIL